jgi:hypothetical protein
VRLFRVGCLVLSAGACRGKRGLNTGPPSTHPSVCLARMAPTKRMVVSRLGNMPTLKVRRRVYLLRRLSGLLEQIWCYKSIGNSLDARMFSLRPSRRATTAGDLFSIGLSNQSNSAWNHPGLVDRKQNKALLSLATPVFSR